MSPDLEQYIHTFLAETKIPFTRLNPELLHGDGSTRRFWRLALPDTNQSFIVMANPPEERISRLENHAYFTIGKHLRRKKVPVPEIYRFDPHQGWFIMEDLGKLCLQDVMRSTQNPLPIYEKVLENLFRLQIEGAKDFSPEWCCQTQEYDRTVMRRLESNYFRDAFLCNYLGGKKEWPELDAPFEHLAEKASQADSRFLIHRDFQSRNIMVSDGSVGFVDWQGARIGPLGYDLASLLIDPYTQLSADIRDSLFQSYLLLIQKHHARQIGSFKRSFPYLAIQRNLQILGAFSFLTTAMRKTHFEPYIPPALSSLRDLLHDVKDSELSPLRRIANDLQLPGQLQTHPPIQDITKNMPRQ